MSLDNKWPLPDLANKEHNDSAEAKNVVAIGKTTGGAYIPILLNDDGTIKINQEFSDNTFKIFDESDNTKVVEFDVGTNVTTGTTRTLKIPDLNGEIALMGVTQSTDFTTTGLGRFDGGLHIETSNTDDPTFTFKTTNTSHQMNMFLDESIVNDEIVFEGQTALKNTQITIKALDGENATLYLQSGDRFGFISYDNTDRLFIVNNQQDENMIFQINDGGVVKTVTWDAANDKFKHSAGTFDYDDDNIVTTGTGTFGTLNSNGNTIDLSDVTNNFVLTFNSSTNTWAGKVVSGGNGSGTVNTLKSSGTQVGDADIATLDFSSNFNLSESPDTEINISVSKTYLEVVV